MKELKINEVFSIKNTIPILFICENNGNVTQVAKKLGLNSTSSVYTALDKLESFNLLTSNLKTERGLRNVIGLTAKGKEILDLLKKIDELLGH